MKTNEKEKYDMPNSMGCRKSFIKREIYNNTGLHQEIRETSNKQSNLTPKGTRKRRINEVQSQ